MLAAQQGNAVKHFERTECRVYSFNRVPNGPRALRRNARPVEHAVKRVENASQRCQQGLANLSAT
jgi:hypothetical protein